jgi:cell division protein FtsI/penicillin-binding protein 2
MYPFGSACAHITGLVNHNEEAVCGVEQYLYFNLRGHDGFVVSERDGLNRELVQERTQNIPANDGFHVVLTIDAKIQHILADELTHCQKCSSGMRLGHRQRCSNGRPFGHRKLRHLRPKRLWKIFIQ